MSAQATVHNATAKNVHTSSLAGSLTKGETLCEHIVDVSKGLKVC